MIISQIKNKEQDAIRHIDEIFEYSYLAWF